MPICAHGLLTNLYIHSLFTMLFDKKLPQETTSGHLGPEIQSLACQARWMATCR